MLNHEQKDEILKLRRKDYGYCSISSILIINRDAVRDFRKSKGLGGFLGLGKLVPIESAWYSFICLYCGKDFKVYGNRYRKYCSRRCCIEHRYGHFKEKAEKNKL